MHLPPYPVFPTLTASRLTLRELREEDLPDILEISVYDGKHAEDLPEAARILHKIERDYQHGNTVHWGIADNDYNRIMGSCGYYRGFANGTGEIGCVLLSEHRGKGVMYEALETAIEFGLAEMQLEQIIAITTRQNYKAIALLERLHFILADPDAAPFRDQKVLVEDELLFLLNRRT